MNSTNYAQPRTRFMSVTQKGKNHNMNELVDIRERPIHEAVWRYCINEKIDIKKFEQPSKDEKIYNVTTFTGQVYVFKINEIRQM